MHMVRHIVAWSFKQELSEKERQEAGNQIKSGLEALVGKIPGLSKAQVFLSPLSTSGSDVMLDCVVESEEALKAYQVHEEHVKVASYIKSVVTDRKCLDFNM